MENRIVKLLFLSGAAYFILRIMFSFYIWFILEHGSAAGIENLFNAILSFLIIIALITIINILMDIRKKNSR